ncbi:ABC-2 family transporter protein [Corynebacterium kutscheri]|uniref:ABC-2 family transporter protein n=1 Tax=Corynebacterium kutscheri TaxID=35755 RepID=A0A0F6QZN7_9CORY|nr:ABC transporter permease [Corynebacterium kutscheri]AKE41272.1 ABC-2 family transporter protein [Corynebacterium kutscheri]VEH09594.1 ABC-type transporter, permease component [Corynebacterium kutscheri]
MYAPGTFSPSPEQASIARILYAQATIEAKLFLRHGEQLLLSFIIPWGMLIAIATLPLIDSPTPLTQAVPMMLSVAAMSSGFTGQAISLAFDRRYGALKRAGASGVPTWAIILGKICGVLVVSTLQLILLLGTSLLFGWSGAVGTAIMVFFLGVAAFTAIGMLVGGTLSSELVLGLANLIWVILVGIASYVIFRAQTQPGVLLNLIPSVSLANGLTTAFSGGIPWLEILILLGWLVLSSLAAIRWFKFTN